MENYKWLEVFDKKDLIKLLNDILPNLCAEIVENNSYDNLSGHLYQLDNILSDWCKLALALQNPELE